MSSSPRLTNDKNPKQLRGEMTPLVGHAPPHNFLIPPNKFLGGDNFQGDETFPLKGKWRYRRPRLFPSGLRGDQPAYSPVHRRSCRPIERCGMMMLRLPEDRDGDGKNLEWMRAGLRYPIRGATSETSSRIRLKCTKTIQ